MIVVCEIYFENNEDHLAQMAGNILAAQPELGEAVADTMARQIDQFALKPFHGCSDELDEFRAICLMA